MPDIVTYGSTRMCWRMCSIFRPTKYQLYLDSRELKFHIYLTAIIID